DPAAAAAAAAATFTGHVSADLAVAARLREQGHGTLVVLSSVAGVRVRRANFVYGAAKAGLDGLAQGLGDALHGTGARVMVVRPGYVPTKMSAHVSAAPFPASAREVADAVAAGLRRGSETVWVPGVLRYVFAGMRVLPRAGWRRLPRRAGGGRLRAGRVGGVPAERPDRAPAGARCPDPPPSGSGAALTGLTGVRRTSMIAGEPGVGTWGTGPFDSDLAADFVDELGGRPPEQVIDTLGAALRCVADS